jgi:hypothetical protein
VNLQPPSMCVFVSGDWHLVHMRDSFFFFLHLWIFTPHAISSESVLAQNGALEYAWIVWSDSVVLSVDGAIAGRGDGCVCSDELA